MKKFLVLLLIIPLFFACKDDASSSSGPTPEAETPVVQQTPTQDPAPTPDPEPAAQPRCGDGKVDEGEDCDGGENCDNTCRFDFSNCTCGDGKVTRELGEQCDDGNNLDGDGCSRKCQVEQTSQAVCGNGKVEGNEACDEGVNNGKAGYCSTECTEIIECYTDSDCINATKPRCNAAIHACAAD